jgi:hypothetical protein
MQGFEPASTSEMVDLFTGDFTYNIPLLDVGGYPVNISYHSGVTMDQEASWVGLGWNINPGTINRNVRGLPDDFMKEQVTKEFNIKPNKTWGIDVGGSVQVFGFGNLGFSTGVFKNSYKGYGLTLGVNPSISAGVAGKGALTSGLGLSLNTQEGTSLSGSLSVGFQSTIKKSDDSFGQGVSLGSSVNSRSGLKALTFSSNTSVSHNSKANSSQKIGAGGSSSLSSFSSSLTFGAPTFTPTVTMPMNNNAIAFNATVGGEFFGIHPDLNMRGYYSKQELAQKVLQLPAFGYIYSHIGTNDSHALLDFNREKDVSYTPEIKNLPIPNFTYDLYSVNGQGISGQFRPHRSDVGILFDHESVSGSTSGDLGLEIGGGGLVHGGFSVTATTVKTTSGKWSSNNSMAPNADFETTRPNPLYEHVYFKNVGEKTVKDTSFQKLIGDINPLQVALSGNEAQALNYFNKFSIYNTAMGSQPVNQKLRREHREKRGQLFSWMSAFEAKSFALSKTIESHPKNQNFNAAFTQISRIDHPAHHISEINVTNPDGKRYVFGIPAYNNYQKEATFAVTKPSSSPDGQVSYSAGFDNTAGNTKGRDNYYSAEITPPYAHSYLLTGILSPDYVDVNSDGISPDDIGEAIKINYSKLLSNYRWRVPYKEDKANYNEGFMSDDKDDKGNYLYGAKEIWMMHSIESKNMVAQFTLENRDDGLGVKDQNGGADTTQKLTRLKEINLYSKYDIIKNGSLAIPLKTVHFVYDYSLCEQIDNAKTAGSGKLTLKEIYFTYGKNTQGRLNSYKFNYSTFNPDYDLKAYDRWGNYQVNPGGYPANKDFPYTIQDSSIVNGWASAWHLNSITMPSGGVINIQYEAKDYAFVQDKRAMQMCLITGIGSSPMNYVPGNTLYNPSSYNSPNNYIVLDVPTPVNDRADIKRKYLEEVNKLYFRCLINVDGKGSWEYVPGYCEYDDYGLVNGNHNKIYIKLRQVEGQHGVVCNPMAKAAWQYLRLNLPEKAFPASNNDDGNLIGLVKSLIGVIGEVGDIVNGFDKRAVDKTYGYTIDCGKSWIRLNNPDYKKYGGGSRVKQITISDNWGAMAAGQSSFSYGNSYKYTTTKVINGVTTEVSSGVAAYEPFVGGDEIPLRNPLPYDIKTLLAPSPEMYTETPLGESMYPAATIGYSKVTVSSINDQYVTRSKTGKTIHEFYTAYDFPVSNNYTDILTKKEKHRPLMGFLGNIHALEYHTASQGITVECNDMHGKPKSESIYDAQNKLLTSTVYHYKVEDENALHKKLVNTADIYNSGGITSSATIGKDIDMWLDMRQQETNVQGVASEFNTESFIIPIFIPLFIMVPPILPKSSTEDTRFRSAVACKFIQRYGILDRVQKNENGSKNEIKNLLFDSETGEVLLTETKNEFEDPVYQANIPAYMVNDQMGPAYKNTGAEFSSLNISGGIITGVASPGDYFSDGDEAYLGNCKEKIWITKLNGGSYGAIRSNGIAVNEINKVKVIKSGRKNMNTATAMSIEAIKNNPMDPGIDTAYITRMDYQAYDDQWRQRCDKIMAIEYDTVQIDTINTDCLAEFFRGLFTIQLIYNSNLLQDFNGLVSVGGIMNFALGGGGVGNDCLIINGTNQNYMLFGPLNINNDSTTYYANFGDYILKIESVVAGEVPLDSLIGVSATFTPCSNCVYLDAAGYASPSAKASIWKVLPDTLCSNLANGTINPYRYGMKNNWHKKSDWAYLDDRIPNTLIETRLKEEGYIDFITDMIPTDTSQQWIKKNEVTYINRNGDEIENKDALNIYSSALYGYGETLPVAVSGNARHRNTANDNFEDYDYRTSNYPICKYDHWNFRDSINGSTCVVTDTFSHSGKYSLKLSANSSISTQRDIIENINDDDTVIVEVGGNHFEKYQSCLPKFSPLPGKYILTAWVKQGDLCPPNPADSMNNSISVMLTDDNNSSIPSIDIHPSGLIIEGWQRYFEEFEIPEEYTPTYPITGITVELSAGTQTTYFDDIRIYPLNAKMKSYVYHPVTNRLMAELDENNYATFYEYDDEGTLIRVKKETEKGIMTLKENRSTYLKQ